MAAALAFPSRPVPWSPLVALDGDADIQRELTHAYSILTRGSCSAIAFATPSPKPVRSPVAAPSLPVGATFGKAARPQRYGSSLVASATGSDQSAGSNRGGEQLLPRKPTPEVGPADVVQAQLKALREKDLASVFEFASPQNQAHTGPLSNFTAIMERSYSVMIGHVEADVLSTFTVGLNRFQQRVAITGCAGKSAVFSWSLSKQEEGPFEGCWMTDSVRRDD